MILKRIIYIISFLTAPFLLLAQYSDSVFYYVGFTSSGTFNKTNESNAYLFNNMLKMGVKKKDIALNSTNKFLYGQQDNVLTNKDISSAWDINLYKTFPHFYYWGLLNYNSTYSLKINNQLLAGVGLAYNIIDKKTLVVNISDGVIYDYSDINPTDSTHEVYGTPRNSLRVQIKWSIKDRVTFSGNSFLQNSLQNQNDYILKTDVSLSIKIRKWLSFTSAYSFNKMTRTKTENTFFTFGFTAERYF